MKQENKKLSPKAQELLKRYIHGEIEVEAMLIELEQAHEKEIGDIFSEINSLRIRKPEFTPEEKGYNIAIDDALFKFKKFLEKAVWLEEKE